MGMHSNAFTEQTFKTNVNSLSYMLRHRREHYNFDALRITNSSDWLGNQQIVQAFKDLLFHVKVATNVFTAFEWWKFEILGSSPPQITMSNPPCEADRDPGIYTSPPPNPRIAPRNDIIHT